MINIKKFDTKKAERELRKVCKENDIPVTAISIISNNMKIYNSFVDAYQLGEVSIHVLFQISGLIMKHLKEFKQTPYKKPIIKLPKPEPEPEPLTKLEEILLENEKKKLAQR
jgi:hypothetical protein